MLTWDEWLLAIPLIIYGAMIRGITGKEIYFNVQESLVLADSDQYPAVQTNFEQLSDTRFVTSLPDAEKVNHLVVFMTGTTPFPDGLGGAVYFAWPSEQGPNWQLLGFISNEKPSAIFKISNLKSVPETPSPFGQGFLPQSPGAPAAVAHTMAQIGISVEPLGALAQQTPAANTTASNASNLVQFSQRMLENLVNYVSSFARTQAQMTPNPTETYVPLSSLQTWFANFTRKIEQDPNFLKS